MNTNLDMIRSARSQGRHASAKSNRLRQEGKLRPEKCPSWTRFSYWLIDQRTKRPKLVKVL